MRYLLITALSVGLFLSCSNKFTFIDWGPDKWTGLESDRSYLICVTATNQEAVNAAATPEALLALKVADHLDNMRFATTIRITPRKSNKTRFEFDEVESIEIEVTEGRHVFTSIPLSNRYDPDTGSFAFYVVAGKNIGFSTVSAKVNGREVFQKDNVYFFENLPYEATIDFSEGNSAGGNASNRRFCPQGSSCSDYLNIDISKMFDEVTPTPNQYFDNAKARIEFTCRYWKKNPGSGFDSLTECGASSGLSKRLSAYPDGTTDFRLNNLRRVVQVYFRRNEIGTANGSVFGIPYFDFLKDIPDDDLKVVLRQTNNPATFIIDQNSLMFAFNRTKFYEESYPESGGIYNEDLQSVLRGNGFSETTLTSKDQKPPNGFNGSPIEVSFDAPYLPFVFNLSASNNRFTHIPVSVEAGDDVRALGALLTPGSIGFNFTAGLSGLNNPTFSQGGEEYEYDFSVSTGTESGRTEFEITVDDKTSVYNKKIIVVPAPPAAINLENIIAFPPPENRSPSTFDAYQVSSREDINDASSNGNDLYFDIAEDPSVSLQHEVFAFLVQPGDSHGNLWEIWDNSDGTDRRLYHNFLTVGGFDRDPCDHGYSGSQDPDPGDHSNPNDPRCAIRINSLDKDGSFISECWDFGTPAEYNIYPNGSANPSDNIHYRYGRTPASNATNGSFSVRIDPDNRNVGGQNGGIASYFYDPVYVTNTSNVYLWANKTLRICPRNEDDFYLRDNTASHYDFQDLPISDSNYFTRATSGYRVNIITMHSPDYLDVRDPHPAEVFKLEYTDGVVVDNSGQEDEPRGRCTPGRCIKIFTPNNDITFYPIPRNNPGSDITAGGNLGSDIDIDIRLRSPDSSPFLSGVLQYYDVSIRQASLNGRTIQRAGRECFRPGEPVSDHQLCGGVYNIDACKMDDGSTYCRCGQGGCDNNAACQSDALNYTYPTVTHTFSSDAQQSSKLCSVGTPYECSIALVGSINSTPHEFQFATSEFSNPPTDACNGVDSTPIADRYYRVIIRARVRGKFSGDTYMWLNFSDKTYSW